MEVDSVKYEKPIMEIIVFENEDVIRTSDVTVGDGDGPVDPWS